MRERRETPVFSVSVFKLWEGLGVICNEKDNNWIMILLSFHPWKDQHSGIFGCRCISMHLLHPVFFVWNLMRLCAVAMFYKLSRFWWENANSDKCWCTVGACLLNWFARLIHCVLFQPLFQCCMSVAGILTKVPNSNGIICDRQRSGNSQTSVHHKGSITFKMHKVSLFWGHD